MWSFGHCAPRGSALSSTAQPRACSLPLLSCHATRRQASGHSHLRQLRCAFKPGSTSSPQPNEAPLPDEQVTDKHLAHQAATAAAQLQQPADGEGLPEDLAAFREYLPEDAFDDTPGANQTPLAAAATASGATAAAENGAGTDPSSSSSSSAVVQLPGTEATSSEEHTPAAALDLAAAAKHFNLISIVQLAAGVLLTIAPGSFLAAAINGVPTALETTFARLMGIALIYRASIAHVLAGAAKRNRLGSTTSQRVMLGCLLPGLAHLMVFKSALDSWGAAWNPGVVAIYPAILAAEFSTYITTFQFYNPYFLLKLIWPLAVGYFVSNLVPIPRFDVQAIPNALSPVTAGLAYGASVKSAHMVAQRAAQKAAVVGAKVARKAVARYARKQIGARSLKALVPEAGKPLTSTVIGKMDYTLPQSGIAWGYWVLMLAHFATMFNAYRPSTLFVGEITAITPLLKQTWSAGFLAAAFTCDALKTAADRHHLGRVGNRQLNLALMLLEGTFAAVLVFGMTVTGTVSHTPYAYVRLATAVASVVFLWAAHQEALRQTTEPTTTSLDWQQATEKRPEYPRVMAAAVLAMNVITCCI